MDRSRVEEELEYLLKKMENADTLKQTKPTLLSNTPTTSPKFPISANPNNNIMKAMKSNTKTTSSLDRQNSVPQHTNAVAIYDYNHPDQNAREFFSFKAGDVFTIIPSERDLQGWKIAISANTEKGFVPGNYLRFLPVAEPTVPTENEMKKDSPAAQVSNTSASSIPITHVTNQNTSSNSRPIKTPPSSASSSALVKPDDKKIKTNKPKDKEEKKDKKEEKKKDKVNKGIFKKKKVIIQRKFCTQY